MARFRTTAAVAALAAVIAFMLLFPAGGHDTDPPECFSVFGYVVPCGLGPEQRHGIGFALAGAGLSALLVAVGSIVAGRENARG